MTGVLVRQFSLVVVLSIMTSLSVAEVTLPGFKPLPAEDPEFSAKIAKFVSEAHLDEMTSAAANPDNEDEWASICVVDLSDVAHPRVAQWKADNFVYPASTYKMYVVGEAVRQVCAGERTLDDRIAVSENNMRSDTRLTTDSKATLSEVLRLICQYSDNTAANVAIDLVDRERVNALLHSMDCRGSEVTRKFLPRSREDARYTSAPSTTSCARHFATFLWAMESGALGGGRGRGLMRGYLATNECNGDRFRGGVPLSATVFSKTGEWDTFTAEAGLIEDGPTRYIMCVLTPFPREVAGPRMATFARSVHQLLKR